MKKKSVKRKTAQKKTHKKTVVKKQKTNNINGLIKAFVKVYSSPVK